MSYYIDECECGQGLIEVIRDLNSKKIILACDDCLRMWESPELFYLNSGFIPLTMETRLEDDVTAEEIISHGWDNYVKNMGGPRD